MSDSKTRAEVWGHMLDGTTRMVKVLEFEQDQELYEYLTKAIWKQ